MAVWISNLEKGMKMRVYNMYKAWNVGSYTNGHFIWNLLNEASASFISFKWNDHECKILKGMEMRVYDMYKAWNIGSYTSGNFIWNLWNEFWASVIIFIWNDQEFKILFYHITVKKLDFIAFKMIIISRRNALLTRTLSMTLRLCTTMCLHVWSYDFCDMTLSTK